MHSHKPEKIAVVGILKFFRYSLIENYLSTNQIQELFKMLKVGIILLKDEKRYEVINGMLFLKLLY